MMDTTATRQHTRVHEHNGGGKEGKNGGEPFDHIHDVPRPLEYLNSDFTNQKNETINFQRPYIKKIEVSMEIVHKKTIPFNVFSMFGPTRFCVFVSKSSPFQFQETF